MIELFLLSCASKELWHTVWRFRARFGSQINHKLVQESSVVHRAIHLPPMFQAAFCNDSDWDKESATTEKRMNVHKERLCGAHDALIDARKTFYHLSQNLQYFSSVLRHQRRRLQSFEDFKGNEVLKRLYRSPLPTERGIPANQMQLANDNACSILATQEVEKNLTQTDTVWDHVCNKEVHILVL